MIEQARRGIPSSSRGLIAVGYLWSIMLIAVTLITTPADAGRFGGGFRFAMALMFCVVVSGFCFLVAAVIAIYALVIARSRFAWFDYVVLAAGVLPLLGLGLVVLRGT